MDAKAIGPTGRCNGGTTLHIEQVPEEVTQALERRALQEKKSVPEVALELMAEGLGVLPGKRRDVSRYRGTWIEDAAVDEALGDFRKIDEDQWR